MAAKNVHNSFARKFKLLDKLLRPSGRNAPAGMSSLRLCGYMMNLNVEFV